MLLSQAVHMKKGRFHVSGRPCSRRHFFRQAGKSAGELEPRYARLKLPAYVFPEFQIL
jgi:hypothetical protein